VIPNAHPIAERDKRTANLNADVDRQLASPAGLGQMTQRPKCLPEIRNGLVIGAARHGAEPRLMVFVATSYPRRAHPAVNAP
jgi:hypothetical protein